MKKIVTIGGGTGSFTILSGLKKIPGVELSAIVSMADNGGSTGILRDELGVLPPGDVRQCLVALSEHTDVVRKLMSYRFEDGGLSGHSFGNILLAALEKVTGTFATGVEVASDILKVRGTVIPVTHNKANLLMRLRSGLILEGENAINHADIQVDEVEKMYYQSGVTLSENARIALMEADCIILGPGNYYCSVLPSVLVEGMKDVLQKTCAKIIFPVNLTNKKGHTLHWNTTTYVQDIENKIGRKVDIILINSTPPSEEQMHTYELLEGDGVLVNDTMSKDSRIIRAPLLNTTLVHFDKSDTIASVRSFIRHDSDLFAEAIQTLL